MYRHVRRAELAVRERRLDSADAGLRSATRVRLFRRRVKSIRVAFAWCRCGGCTDRVSDDMIRVGLSSWRLETNQRNRIVACSLQLKTTAKGAGSPAVPSARDGTTNQPTHPTNPTQPNPTFHIDTWLLTTQQDPPQRMFPQPDTRDASTIQARAQDTHRRTHPPVSQPRAISSLHL